MNRTWVACCLLSALLALVAAPVSAEEMAEGAMAGMSAPTLEEGSAAAPAASEPMERLLVLPALALPSVLIEEFPYPGDDAIAEGEKLLRDAIRFGMLDASKDAPACQSKSFGPHVNSDPKCFDWCFGAFVSPGSWGTKACCAMETCFMAPSIWAPIGFCGACPSSAAASPKAGPAPPPPKPKVDCVDAAQKLNDGNAPCRRNKGAEAGGFSKQAPETMNMTCMALKAAADAVAAPSAACCADLVKFIGNGCTCDNNLARLAHDFASTDYDTFHAIGRVAQMQCGYGTVYDPCLQTKGTCDTWSYLPSPGTRPNN